MVQMRDICLAFTTRIPLAVMIAMGIKQWENRAAMPSPPMRAMRDDLLEVLGREGVRERPRLGGARVQAEGVRRLAPMGADRGMARVAGRRSGTHVRGVSAPQTVRPLLSRWWKDSGENRAH